MTSGAQQAIDLAARTLLEPGDVVVVESPTFTGSLLALRSTGARVIGVPVDDDGLDVDALEQVLSRHEIKLCALQTACQNPTGADLSAERRTRLAELAVERNFFVLEDAVYADLRFDGERPPSLRREAPGPRALRELPVQGRGRRPAGGLDRRPRSGARAADHAQAGLGLPHPHARAAHRGALHGHRRLRPRAGAQRALLPRAARRADGRAAAPPRGRVRRRHAARRPPRVGDAAPAGGGAHALLRGDPPRRVVHARGARSPPSASRRRACGCPSPWSSPRSSTRASGAWRGRCARCGAGRARRWPPRCPSSGRSAAVAELAPGLHAIPELAHRRQVLLARSG